MDVGGGMGLATFVVTSTISPGGATALATTSGAHFGLRRSIPALGGISFALAMMAAAAAVGLGSLIVAVPAVRLALKVVGSGYLLYLAVRTARGGAPGAVFSDAVPMGFFGGALLLLYNPKGWAMTIAAAASFASLLSNPAWLAALFGSTFAIMASISLTAWCLVALSRLLTTHRQWTVLNVVLALMVVVSIVPIWLGP